MGDAKARQYGLISSCRAVSAGTLMFWRHASPGGICMRSGWRWVTRCVPAIVGPVVCQQKMVIACTVPGFPPKMVIACTVPGFPRFSRPRLSPGFPSGRTRNAQQETRNGCSTRSIAPLEIPLGQFGLLLKRVFPAGLGFILLAQALEDVPQIEQSLRKHGTLL